MNIENPQAYIDGVISRDRRMMSKTITLIESSLATHQKAARRIIDAFLPHTGNAVRLGITGVPGVGKSTFIESLGMSLVKDSHRVAVLAVDPSSIRSGGSVMADKTRMEKLTSEENAFIRPSPSGGALGGVARKTRETMLICEAAGYDLIIVETVGVGQSESTVASMVDFFLVLMLDWMWSLIEEGIRIRFNQNPEVKSRLRKISHAVEKGNTAPTVAAEELLFFLDKN